MPEKSDNKNSNTGMIITLIVFLLLLGGAVVFIVYMEKKPPMAPPQPGAQPQPAADTSGDDGGGGGGGDNGSSSGSSYFPYPPTVNPIAAAFAGNTAEQKVLNATGTLINQNLNENPIATVPGGHITVPVSGGGATLAGVRTIGSAPSLPSGFHHFESIEEIFG